MVSINISGFATKIEEYLHFPEQFNQETIVDTLDLVDPQSKYGERNGITFGHNTKLVMQLLARAYYSLDKYNNSTTFSNKVAHTIQNFADPFPKGDNLCYPHFLLHGLVQPNIDEVIKKIENNSRIIHETINTKNKIMKEYGNVTLNGNLQLMMADGATDDYFGIAYLLAKQDAILVSSASNYITKTSFFIDNTNNELYVITIQGKRFSPHDPIRAAHPSGQKAKRAAEQEYAKIGNTIGMGPRRFCLEQLMGFAKNSGFNKIKVIKPQEHPMFIEEHVGFLANYESVITKAGITTENECYLEKIL